MKSGWSSLQANSCPSRETPLSGGVRVRGCAHPWVGSQARMCWQSRRALFENCIASTRSQSILFNSSYKGLTVDALALGADEGRGRLR